MLRRSPCACALVVALLLVVVPATARPVVAQLISPGRLSADHSGLEGIRGCTNCHELGKKGASDVRCLECHAPLKERMTRRSGYHGGLDANCASCHKEHFGREFALVRLDTAAFEHGRAGWVLEKSHASVECAACHSPERVVAGDVREWLSRHETAAGTMLGLAKTCSSCHAADDPHANQFDVSCEQCHDSGRWTEAVRFDHDRTAWPLTGLHRSATCEGCHGAEVRGGRSVTKYVGTRASSCTTCHRDEHDGGMGGECTVCHDTGGWQRVDRTSVENRFDHGGTRFPLLGRHASAGCSGCHVEGSAGQEIRLRFPRSERGASFPRPAFDGCLACHVDRHDGQFAAEPVNAACDRCHTESGWLPAGFDIDRHATETQFPLTGVHLYTPCAACHGGGDSSHARFTIERECASCHATDSPHGDQFGERGCADCHDTGSFTTGTFDHTLAATSSCTTCHAEDDPHAEQFDGRECASCHDTGSFRIDGFDHGATRFALDGAHAAVDCAGCHPAETIDSRTVVRYTPRPTACSACHGVDS